MSAILQPGGAVSGGLDPALLAGAAELDAAAAAAEASIARPFGQPGAAAPAGPPPIDWQHEAHDLVDFCSGMFFPLYPRLETVWTPAKCQTLETRLAAVLQKYNLNMGVLLGKWGPEIMLAATIAPNVLPTVKAIKDDLAELRARQPGAKAAPPPESPAAAPPPPQPPPGERINQGPPPPPDQAQLHQQA